MLRGDICDRSVYETTALSDTSLSPLVWSAKCVLPDPTSCITVTSLKSLSMAVPALILEQRSEMQDSIAALASLCLLPPNIWASTSVGVGLLGYGLRSSLYGYIICTSRVRGVALLPS